MIPADKMPEFYRAVRMLDNAVTRDFLSLLMFTGLRKGEASSLRWTDINLEHRTITLPPEKTKAKRELVLIAGPPCANAASAASVVRTGAGRVQLWRLF